MHGLDRTQGSVLPDTGFTLPPLQGHTIDEHFYRIGERAAQPWLDFARDLAYVELPPALTIGNPVWLDKVLLSP